MKTQINLTMILEISGGGRGNIIAARTPLPLVRRRGNKTLRPTARKHKVRIRARGRLEASVLMSSFISRGTKVMTRLSNVHHG